jgi:hypothetical protein
MLETRTCIASHASDADYAPTSRNLLWKLGYALVPAEEAEAPALRVVRDDRLAEVAAPHAEPIILLTQGRGRKSRDPRVLGSVKRPAGLHELYRLIQAALEEQPRSVPRAPCSLVARGRSEERRWDLVVQSLSESGCLATGAELPAIDTAFELEMELPWGLQIATPAVAAYEQGGSLGVVFHGVTLGARQKLAKAVLQLLERL